MNNPQIYEKVVKRKNNRSRVMAKILAVAGYVGFDLLWLLAAIRTKYNLGILALAVISTVFLIIFTWRFFALEYEYSFVGSEITVAKIYANRLRRQVLSEDLRNAVMIAPATDENISRLERFEIDKSIHAISSSSYDDIWLCLFEQEKTQVYTCLYIDADERITRIFKQYNPHSTQKIN